MTSLTTEIMLHVCINSRVLLTEFWHLTGTSACLFPALYNMAENLTCRPTEPVICNSFDFRLRMS